MKPALHPDSLFSRLRRLTWLPILLLFVLIGKVGSVQAGVGEDLAGFESGSTSAWLVDLDSDLKDGLNDPAEPSSPTGGHPAGGCCHCSCHQADAMFGAAVDLVLAEGRSQVESHLRAPRHARLARELRPPIL